MHAELGGIETPGALEVARIPSVSVPVCVVTSVPVCAVKVVSETPSVEEPPCMDETPGMSEPPCMSETPCVSGVVTSVPECVLPGTPCVKGAPQPETACVCEARSMNEILFLVSLFFLVLNKLPEGEEKLLLDIP